MSAHCHHGHHDHGAPGHSHASPASADPRYRRILWIALIVNAAMFVIELGAGCLLYTSPSPRDRG